MNTLKNFWEKHKLTRELLFAIVIGNILMWFASYSVFERMGSQHPATLEAFELVTVNVILAMIRSKYPKVWKMLTTEDLETISEKD